MDSALQLLQLRLQDRILTATPALFHPAPGQKAKSTHLSRTGWKGDFNCCGGESDLGTRSLSAREQKTRRVKRGV